MSDFMSFTKVHSRNINFRETKAYEKIKRFIFLVDASIKSEKQIERDLDILNRIEKIVLEEPLSTQPCRYANAAMKTVIEKIINLFENKPKNAPIFSESHHNNAQSADSKIIPDDETIISEDKRDIESNANNKIEMDDCFMEDCLREYLCESFGNPIRMDFGTGHELNFLCYLYVLYCKDFIKINEVLSIFKKYFSIVRMYLKKFNIEPAGARGCWSIDDFLLFPFVFGSSENFLRKEKIELIEGGLFKESWEIRKQHGVLENICKLEWPQINTGLLKMYDEEVLGKSVVTQHFIYSSFLPSNK
jgi:Phosphotyrosyl phosphate activator (PTPA) protein